MNHNNLTRPPTTSPQMWFMWGISPQPPFFRLVKFMVHPDGSFWAARPSNKEFIQNLRLFPICLRVQHFERGLGNCKPAHARNPQRDAVFVRFTGKECQVEGVALSDLAQLGGGVERGGYSAHFRAIPPTGKPPHVELESPLILPTSSRLENKPNPQLDETRFDTSIGVDSPFCSVIVLFKNLPFRLGFWRFSGKKDP